MALAEGIQEKMSEKKEENIKKSVFSGLIWKFIEVLSVDGVSFVVSIILARLLMPEDFGEISLVTIFITLANVFVVYGLGTALIQKKDSNSVDFSSVFYFNGLLSIVLYVILFCCAPLIASFYGSENLTLILRILGLRIPIASITTIQNAYVSKHMQFQKAFWGSLIGTILSAAIGIWMAYNGYGVWALVGQTLGATSINCIVLFFVIKWKPTLEFSWERLKGLIQYGWKLLVSGFIKVGYDQVSGLIIGKKYTSEDLGLYTKGRKYPELIVTGVNSSMSSVLFPAYAKYQDDKPRLKNMVRRSISLSTYLMSPLLLGLAALATPIISFLLTDKWLGCVPYLQIACFYYVLQPVQTANLQAIRAVGRSDIILKLDIVKRGFGLLFVLIAMWYGVIWIALAPVAMSLLASIINIMPNKKLIGYTFKEQMADLLPNLLLSGTMGFLCLQLSNWLLYEELANIWIILIGVIFGGLYYLVGSIISKNKSWIYVLESMKDLFSKKNSQKKEDIESGKQDIK